MKKCRIIAYLLCVLMVLTSCGAQKSDNTIYDAAMAAYGAQKSLCAVIGDIYDAQNELPAGSSISDWTMVACSVLGVEGKRENYLAALESYVSEQYRSSGGLSRAKATEWHRIAITVMALGGDPCSFGINSDGEAIDLIADGTYDYIGSDLGAQGLNAYIYALITLDAGNFDVPEGSRYSCKDILNSILAAQEDDGGFGLVPGSSSTDITAMALQALAPYIGDAKVKTASDAALGFLSSVQESDGGYMSSGESSSESCSQVIIALCALGLDPETDERFIKNGVSVFDALMNFTMSDGSFAHTTGDASGNPLATEQAMLALASVMRFRAGEKTVLSFT